MRWIHLRATLWMRWRALINGTRRASKLNNFLFAVFAILGVCFMSFSLLGGFVIGGELLEELDAMGVMMTWVVLSGALLFGWTIGLVTDLQRGDSMSFKNLLHLPISLAWVFLYNYASSWVSLSFALFVPPMIGLCAAMVVFVGPHTLIVPLLVFAFLAMITALTYQLRGWLARLMENKRRGKNIVAAITVVFVLGAQLPNLINLSLSRSRLEDSEQAIEQLEESQDREAYFAQRKADRAQREAEIDELFTTGAMVLPVGWLAFGARAAYEGRVLPGVLCFLGMFSIAGLSLRRSYRKTVAAVIEGHGGAAEVEARPAEDDAIDAKTRLLVQRELPFVHETVSAVALGGLRSLLRAPETKMMLISPLIMLAFFGVMAFGNQGLGEFQAFAPMMRLGAIALVLVSISPLLQNQFGLDRQGFRAYVLSPMPRHRILMGKNLATAPLALAIGVIALVGMQFLLAVDAEHFVAGFVQLLSGYVLMCMLGNFISIYGPMRLREQGMRAAGMKVKTFLWQFFSVFAIPLMLSPLLLPGLAKLMLRGQDWTKAVPVFLLLHIVILAGVLIAYRFVVRMEGDLYQEREQHILDVLTREA